MCGLKTKWPNINRKGRGWACLSSFPPSSFVTENQAQLLVAQKTILKRQGWWREKFALFWRPATWGEGRFVSKGWLPLENWWAKAFIDRGRGLHAETALSALMVILKLVAGCLTSVILIVIVAVVYHYSPLNWVWRKHLDMSLLLSTSLCSVLLLVSC